MKPTTQLRKLLERNELLIAPGAPNAITARLIQNAGFPVVYVSGAGISNTQMGLADMGLLTMSEMVSQIRYITNIVQIPVIADADTGYGNAINMQRTVREYENAGVAAIQIEDQVTPKRCGHFEGKQIVTKDEMVGKIKAALDARVDPDLVIIARTDARQTNGLQEAIERSQAYVEAGADMIFLEAPESSKELELITKHVKAPLVANMVEDGKTPILSSQALQDMGFKLVIYANMANRISIKAIQAGLEHLRNNGSSIGLEDRMITMKERGELTDLSRLQELEQKYLYLS
ncbi:MAG: carboxyvinyl-carboxyphosphonate phosphorylmutase [Bacilli bacterium]|nr:carboxyvinyl-carboxyphosphonate phosphorylmutase [Bacilli bacterium]